MFVPDVPVPDEGLYVTHFMTVADQSRSRDFYAGVLGGKVVSPRDPTIIKFANSWIILNDGGGPTPDKPDVTLEPPQSPTRGRSEEVGDLVGGPRVGRVAEAERGSPRTVRAMSSSTRHPTTSSTRPGVDG